MILVTCLFEWQAGVFGAFLAIGCPCVEAPGGEYYSEPVENTDDGLCWSGLHTVLTHTAAKSAATEAAAAAPPPATAAEPPPGLDLPPPAAAESQPPSPPPPPQLPALEPESPSPPRIVQGLHVRVRVTVPPNASAGQMVQFQLVGRAVRCTVPPGLQPGMQFACGVALPPAQCQGSASSSFATAASNGAKPAVGAVAAGKVAAAAVAKDAATAAKNDAIVKATVAKLLAGLAEPLVVGVTAAVAELGAGASLPCSLDALNEMSRSADRRCQLSAVARATYLGVKLRLRREAVKPKRSKAEHWD